jgi:hypothetical protein
VLQVTAFRISIIIGIGIILYFSLLFAIGLIEGRHLKKKKSVSDKNKESAKVKIVLMYLLILYATIVLCFLLIENYIRGMN